MAGCNLHSAFSGMESTSEKILYDIFVPTEWEEPVTIEISCRLMLSLVPRLHVMGMSDTPFFKDMSPVEALQPGSRSLISENYV